MRNTGPTEVRVRAALLRLWDAGTGLGPFRHSSADVREECERDGDGKMSGVEAVKRIGQRAAKGQTMFSRGPWCELLDDVEFTYGRGTFTIRRRPAKRRRERAPLDIDPNPPAHVLARPTRDEQTEVNRGRTPARSRCSCNCCFDGKPLPEPRPRRPFDDDSPDGYLESDRDYLENNNALAVHLLDAHVHERANAEPRVTQRHLDLMRTATGGSITKLRNSFFASTDQLCTEWLDLVGMKLAKLHGEDPRLFAVTDAGFRMVYGETRKPARKRAKR